MTTGGPTPAGPYQRPFALIGAVLMMWALVGCGAALDVTSDQGQDSSSDGGSSAEAVSGSALDALAEIKVKGRASNTGYSRDEFGTAWSDTDNNGCDQRNDILRRDLTDETLKARTKGCVVLSGTLADRYTGDTIAFTKTDATAVHIDHVVALQNAWVTGASGWSADKRKQLATDPLNLLAVGSSVNESKGSGDAATWLPPRKAFRCTYVARQVAVKAKYGAWMTTGEQKAIKAILSGCPDQKLPEAKTVPLGPADSSSSSSSDSSSSDSSDSSSSSDSSETSVSAGAFCSPEGATGQTSAGTAMVCSSKNGDRARWRSSGT